MTNVFNNGTVTGNLANQPKAFGNQNGSTVIFLNVSIKHHTKDGKTGFTNVGLRFYSTSPKQVDFITSLQKGRLVTVEFHLNTYKKTDNNGQTTSELQAFADNIEVLESERTFNARQNYNAQQAQTNAYQQQPVNSGYQQAQQNNGYQQPTQPQAPQGNRYQQPVQPQTNGYQQQQPTQPQAPRNPQNNDSFLNSLSDADLPF